MRAAAAGAGKDTVNNRIRMLAAAVVKAMARRLGFLRQLQRHHVKPCDNWSLTHRTVAQRPAWKRGEGILDVQIDHK